MSFRDKFLVIVCIEKRDVIFRIRRNTKLRVFRNANLALARISSTSTSSAFFSFLWYIFLSNSNIRCLYFTSLLLPEELWLCIMCIERALCAFRTYLYLYTSCLLINDFTCFFIYHNSSNISIYLINFIMFNLYKVYRMPKYYCDYCDTFLTHDSPSVRKTHNGGRKHKENVRMFYQVSVLFRMCS